MAVNDLFGSVGLQAKSDFLGIEIPLFTRKSVSESKENRGRRFKPLLSHRAPLSSGTPAIFLANFSGESPVNVRAAAADLELVFGCLNGEQGGGNLAKCCVGNSGEERFQRRRKSAETTHSPAETLQARNCSLFGNIPMWACFRKSQGLIFGQVI
ncbi:hypothetical protein U1Q18_016797 [Sarracenia purpurea var. burkii]